MGETDASSIACLSTNMPITPTIGTDQEGGTVQRSTSEGTLLGVQQVASTIRNATVPDLTNGQPAVWSPEAVGLLRGYGYTNAVVYSDSMTVEAIPGTLQDAALKAWQAGVDVAMIVQTKDQTADVASFLSQIITHAKTTLANNSLERSSVVKSVARILARKNINPRTIGNQ
jgi:beta-glucosidase-like glycosyl hydrolase